MTHTMAEIETTRDGIVHRKNYTYLGYERLVRGVYGKKRSTEGLTEWDLQRQRFLRLARGAMRQYETKGAVLHGVSALQVLGVALPHRLEDFESCHLSFPPGVSRPERIGVHPHRHPAQPQIWRYVNGYPVLHPVEHLLQIRHATVDELVEIADGFLRRQNPLITMEEMKPMVLSMSGRLGLTKVRKAMKWVRPNTDSLLETRTRLILIRHGLPEPTVNLPVYSSLAKKYYYLDLGYEKEKLAVEYDGLIHVHSREQMENDAIRRNHLQDEGWMVITLTAEQIEHPMRVVQTVTSNLALRRGALSSTR